jgi:predicted  nucleic acid-binding Zn-ribbon protein
MTKAELDKEIEAAENDLRFAEEEVTSLENFIEELKAEREAATE